MKKHILTFVLFISIGLTYSQTNLEEALNFTGITTHDEELELFPILDEGKLVVIDFFHTE